MVFWFFVCVVFFFFFGGGGGGLFSRGDGRLKVLTDDPHPNLTANIPPHPLHGKHGSLSCSSFNSPP